MTISNTPQTAHDLVKQMTLEEKTSLLSGKNFWETRAIERLRIPSFMLTDGPHGLRKQAGDADHLGLNASVPSTCFPTAAATACSFDRDLLKQMGIALGEECRAEGVSVILGPAANIKRSPLCGRNFEYFSEDPLVSGELSAALINGVQSKNVGTSMKHYLANNQEKARVGSDSIVDERALREIYLRSFEIAVKKAQPWTLMCSYNKINGTYASDNKRMMSDILRDEWGFQGAVVTDWGAMNDRVEAVKAGLDLEMPGGSDHNNQKVLKAIQEHTLKEEELDRCVERLVDLALRSTKTTQEPYDHEEHNRLSAKIARESCVLLKNDHTLPLSESCNIAVIGEFAKNPRYQGAGSSKINPYKITSLCDALDKRGISYSYEAGYHAKDDQDESEFSNAILAVQKADVAIIMLGLPDSYESEGFDRPHMELPDVQNKLIEALRDTDTPLIVILSTGAAVHLPWKNHVNSILLAYLTGQNGGTALADLLFGDASPCGKLAESWPEKINDTPCHGFFGEKGIVEYRESIYVGYRYYEKAHKEVAYPFGHGLSYTSFAYNNLTVNIKDAAQPYNIDITMDITNTGSYTGKEIVQLYVGAPQGKIHHPLKELRDFQKVQLMPGETKNITFHLDERAFSYYDIKKNDWIIEEGNYMIMAAASSSDIRLIQELKLPGCSPDAMSPEELISYDNPDKAWPPSKAQFEKILNHAVPEQVRLRPFTVNSTLSDIQTTRVGRTFVKQVKENIFKELKTDDGDNELTMILEAMLDDMPLRQLAMMSNGALNETILEGLLEMMNGHYLKGLKRMRK